ncbi:MAG: hypothetical protein COY81_03405 [Candidatus Pacebacteria bacterium CG_4_10_14_0_8_um_filter_43_12]|nr:MAG: hypothetical protein COU66_01660 [Candidatus Pacebacteria bacterium CG10_big_fil_rev_8_21_14_0_10_44_11]PIY79298.1 MAG: hypothetical protein COY81_03405 [Candidatus Pacebacteria bacterium CG_4_10_14_0_8_um_filter_43_12]
MNNLSKEELAAHIEDLTNTIEARKEQRERDRQKKKNVAEKKKQRQLVERLVAPLILIMTVMLSLLFWLFAS